MGLGKLSALNNIKVLAHKTGGDLYRQVLETMHIRSYKQKVCDSGSLGFHCTSIH